MRFFGIDGLRSQLTSRSAWGGGCQTWDEAFRAQRTSPGSLGGTAIRIIIIIIISSSCTIIITVTIYDFFFSIFFY